MALAHALRENRTMTNLDITHNEIKEKGCFVIADMLKENRGLEQVSFQWKNPDFLLKNPDFLLKNPDFLMKTDQA